MIYTSANYKTAIKAVSREIRAYLKFNGSTIYRGVDGLVSINWNAQLFDKERFCVNCANAAYIEAEMYGEPIQNLESAYVEAFIGVVLEYKSAKPSGSIEDDTADVEYVKIGRFDVTEVVRKNGKVMISAYDRMAKLSENYVTTVTPTSSGYSKASIVTDIKNQCGLTWTQSFSGYVPEIVNSTMRDQLCWLYGSTTSTGQSLMLSRDGTTVISKVIVGQTALNYTIDEATTYLDGLNDQPTFTITSYTANAGENTYSYGSGAGVECYNPYISSTTASNTYNFIKNFSYTPMTLEFRGDPAIELGDILTVTSGNNSYSVVVMKMATVFNGGLKTTIYCYGNTEEWDAISNSPTGARIIQTENMVRIEASRATEAEGQLQSAIEANAEAITLRATKTEAQGYASDAESAAKSYADSQITVKAGEILSTVSANTPAVNLLPSVYRSESNGFIRVSNGITWTVNADGSVTATGTATADSTYNLSYNDSSAPVPWLSIDANKKYTMSGVPNVTGCRFSITIYNSSGATQATYTITNGSTRAIPENENYKYAYAYLRIVNGTTLPSVGVTFYPQLEAGDTAHAYVSTHSGSYAMESRITQNAEEIELKVSEEDITGNYVIGKINLNSTTATIAAEHINLQGAVSISSLDSGLQSSVNGIPAINLLPSVYSREATSGSTWTSGGITWTVNADGSVTAIGTASANSDYYLTNTSDTTIARIKLDHTKKYTFSGVPLVTGCQFRVGLYTQTGTSASTTRAIESVASYTQAAGYYYAVPYLRIVSGTALPSGGVTFYPMFEVGDVAHVYVSTHNGSSYLTNTSQTAQTTANTAVANMPIVNLLPNVYYYESLYGSSWTSSGITWTVNPNGSITATGTATANTSYSFMVSNDTGSVPRIVLDPTKKYTWSGCPPTGSSSTYRTMFRCYADATTTSYTTYYDTGSGVTSATGFVRAYAFLYIYSGYACPTDGLTFYPMLEVGDTKHAYVSTHNGTGTLNRQEQLIYRSAASGTTTMAATTTWVTDVTGGQNKWTAVRPQYSQTYPVLFVATQRQTMGGTVTCTAPKIDETTTVIDGGHIITGTIDANKITANTTFTQKLYASDLNITGGSINITTQSETTDKIQLSYNEWTNRISPLEWRLTNTNINRMMLGQAGAIFGYDINGSTEQQRFSLGNESLSFKRADGSSSAYFTSAGTIRLYNERSIQSFYVDSSSLMYLGTMGQPGYLHVRSATDGVDAIYLNGSTGNVEATRVTVTGGGNGASPTNASYLASVPANTGAHFVAYNTSSQKGIDLTIGESGTNRGIADITDGGNGGWIWYYDNTRLRITKNTNIQGSAQYPSVYFNSSDMQGGAYIQIYGVGASINSIYNMPQLAIREFSYNTSTGKVLGSYYEDYYLPAVTANRTSTAAYHFLTTKVTGALTESDPTTTTALANNTYKSCGSVSLAAGTWLVMVEAQFAANGTGTRYLIPSYTADSSSTAVHWSAEAIMPAVTASGYATAVKSTFVAHPTATSTVYFNCWQNSGSSLNVKIRYQILRIL